MAKTHEILGLFLLAFALSLATGTAAVRFGTGFKANPHYVLPALAALEKGYWSELGLETKWIPFDAATTMVRAAAAKEVDVGTLGLNTVILSVSRGVPIIAVADPGIKTVFSFWVKPDSRIRKPEELKGARIGVTQFGSESHAYAVAAIRALGLEKDVKFISMGGGGPQMAGIRAGVIDVTNLSFFSAAALVARGDVRLVLKVPDYLPPEYAHLQMTFAVTDFFNKQGEAVRKAHRGFVKGEELVEKNQPWTIEKLKSEFRYTEAAAQAAYPILTYAPKDKIDKRQIEGAIRFLLEYGLLKKEQAPLPEKVYLEGFTP